MNTASSTLSSACPPRWRVTLEMTQESRESDYSDDEIEQILGTGAPEVRLTLKAIEDIISENPLLVTGVVFALGILLGVSLGSARRRRS
jgi:hypothetical protein